jgi:hypothetical protein
VSRLLRIQLEIVDLRLLDDTDGHDLICAEVEQLTRNQLADAAARRAAERTCTPSGECETCGEPSLAAGRWCYRHFRQFVVDARREREERARQAGRALSATTHNRQAVA